MDASAFCFELASEFAVVKSLLDAHLDEFGELLPHVFFGDLTRLVLTDVASRVGIVTALERSFSCDPSIQNLIAVSFIENLESRSQLDLALKDVEAPNIRNEWNKMYARR
jgi:hypothetical protein